MSLRQPSWPIFGLRPDSQRETTKPPLTLIEGGKGPLLARLSARTRFFVAMMSVLIALFGVVTFHVMLSQGQFKLERMQARADEQQVRYEKLRLQVAEMESPSHVTQQASRLGLVPAKKVTPVTPHANDIPAQGIDGSFGGISSTTDASRWNEVKPHLSSSAK